MEKLLTEWAERLEEIATPVMGIRVFFAERLQDERWAGVCDVLLDELKDLAGEMRACTSDIPTEEIDAEDDQQGNLPLMEIYDDPEDDGTS
jgi:hypothetical protein